MKVIPNTFGIQSYKFFDINKLQHRFPQEIRSIGFSVTLLHNHWHAKPDQMLLYSEDFRQAHYTNKEICQEYSPCSWYLQFGQVIPYQFTEAHIKANMEQIRSNLEILREKGYENYGVSIRPIENVVEIETKDGHKYFDRKTFEMKPDWISSQTATNGNDVNQCYAYTTCVITQMLAHVTDYGHD